MVFSAERKAYSGSEHGSAFLDCLLIVPMLIMTVVATCDLGNALNHYIVLNRVANEGSRFALSLSGERQEPYSEVALRLAPEELVKQRVEDLLRHEGLNPNAMQVTTASSKNNLVSVTLGVNYRSLFGFFSHMPIQASSSGHAPTVREKLT